MLFMVIPQGESLRAFDFVCLPAGYLRRRLRLRFASAAPPRETFGIKTDSQNPRMRGTQVARRDHRQANIPFIPVSSEFQ